MQTQSKLFDQSHIKKRLHQCGPKKDDEGLQFTQQDTPQNKRNYCVFIRQILTNCKALDFYYNKLLINTESGCVGMVAARNQNTVNSLLTVVVRLQRVRKNSDKQALTQLRSLIMKLLSVTSKCMQVIRVLQTYFLLEFYKFLNLKQILITLCLQLANVTTEMKNSCYSNPPDLIVCFITRTSCSLKPTSN